MYALVNLPLRKAIKPSTPASATVPWSHEEIGAVDRCRDEYMGIVDRCREAFDNRRHGAILGNETLRNEIVSTLTAAADQYTQMLCGLVAKHPKAAQARYYFWGASVTERLNHAFGDYRYELLNVYINVALVYHESARFVLEVPQGSPMTDGMEKEGYTAMCFAAGYTQIAHTLALDMQSAPLPEAPKHDMLEESKPAFLECLVNLFLEEAQFLGMEKALRNEANKNKEIVPKLTHQVLALSHKALDLATMKLNSNTPHFKALVARLQVRNAVATALVYAQTAPCRFDKSAAEALWFTKTAEAHMTQLATWRGKLLKIEDESGSIKRLTDWALTQGKRVDASVDRIRQMNSLVTREKMGEGPYSLPTAQELARVKPVALPCPLPSTLSPSVAPTTPSTAATGATTTQPPSPPPSTQAV